MSAPADLPLPATRLAAALPAWRARVNPADWWNCARAVAEGGGRLVALWGHTDAGNAVLACAYAVRAGVLWVDLPLGTEPAPDLSPLFPAATRMQRAAADLAGLRWGEGSDRRPWLNHGTWPADWAPLRDTTGVGPAPGPVADYPFVRVGGDGVHEIPVGPVHAGIIEPGHFRFSIVGEKVLRLEERLGYTHKGIGRLLLGASGAAGARLAGRVSGDSTVAHAWAWCMALEAAAGQELPARAAALRALLLERERVANHLGDLGALGNDAGLAFGLAQFSRLREDWQRLSAELWGHRLLMDAIVPGGVARDLDAAACGRLRAQCDAIEREVGVLRTIYDEHAGLQDRCIGCGRVGPELAARLGLIGLAGRASAQAWDLRCDQPFAPYAALDVSMATQRNGDVAARIAVRFDEIVEALRLIRALCADLPGGPWRSALAEPAARSAGVGWVEGWRGEVFVALELEAGRVVQAHLHDPSWHNWPVLEHAVIGNIVPDFPLINKSFNLSYSGHDL